MPFRRWHNRHYENIDGKVTDITDQIPFEIPQGWEWCRLGEICKAINVGIVIQPTRYYTEMSHGIPAFRNCNIRQGQIDATEWVYLRKEALIENPRSVVHYQDIIMARSGCPGIACSVPSEYDGYSAVDILIASVFTDYISSCFIEKNINSQTIQNRIAIINRGVALSHIGVTTIDKLLLPIPPFVEQQRIVSCIEQLFVLCDTIDKADENLENTVSLARQKVLDLAIRGQLVPQNPDDEPASELLKRIQAEKAAQVKAGKRKADKRESTITRGGDNRYYENVNGKTIDITDQIPFEIPLSWEWVRLGMLCDYGVCQSRLPSEIPSNCWLLELEDIEKDTGRLLNRVFRAEREASSPKHSFQKGNVLYSKLRTYLNKVLIADMDGCCTSEILPLDFGKTVKAEYARLVLMSSMFLSYTATCGYGVKMPRLGTEDGRKALFPLPPLPEQQRIVDAVSSFIATLSNL